MNKLIAFIFVFSIFTSPSIFAQTQDSILVTYESDVLLLEKNVTKNTYSLTNKENKESFTDLKYIERMFQYFQVLDKDNQIFYINEEWEKKDEAQDFIGLCGTVPHYKLSILSEKDSFLITIDETFYDMGNEFPAEPLMRISKEKADKILFINGDSTFTYSANFSYSNKVTPPNTVILVKDGKYSIYGEEEMIIDAIDFTAFSPALKYSVGELHGFLHITAPKYLKMSDFSDNLAQVVTKDGREIYIDMEGNEYF